MDLTLDWAFVADIVMGGVSQGRLAREIVAGRPATRLTGRVSLENGGGFLQMAADIDDGRAVNLSDWTGIALDVTGNSEGYELRLRTSDLMRPWQSYRAPFTAPPDWRTIRVAFADLDSHRTEAPFDPGAVRRIGVLAIGRVFDADISIAAIRLWRD